MAGPEYAVDDLLQDLHGRENKQMNPTHCSVAVFPSTCLVNYKANWQNLVKTQKRLSSINEKH